MIYQKFNCQENKHEKCMMISKEKQLFTLKVSMCNLFVLILAR